MSFLSAGKLDKDQFVSIFSPPPSGYSDLHRLADRHVGVSVQRSYPADCAFKPTIAQNGEQDSVVLIHVLADGGAAAGEDPNKIPIRIRASRFSRYLSNHLDYDSSDAASPSDENVRESRQSKQPIDLLITDEFFVGTHGEIYDKTGRIASAKVVLDFAYEAHVRTLRSLNPHRVRLHWAKASRLLLGPIFDAAVVSLSLVLKWPLGRELVKDTQLRFLFHGYRREDVKKLTADSIKLFEYLVPKHIAITFCVLVVVSFVVYHALGLSFAYVHAVMANAVLTLAHAILILMLLDVVLPELARRLLNFFIVRRSRIG